MPFHKGQSGNPAGKPPGIKNSATIKREERRALFDDHVSKKFLDLVDQAKPEYLIDQFLGKAADKVEVTGTILNANISLEAIEKAEELVKAKLIDG